MKRTNKVEINLNQSSQEYDLNKISTGCAPYLNEVSKMEQKISKRKLSEIKIEEIKDIVKQIFKNDNKKN